MWNNKDSDAGMKFFEATSDWYSTWDGKEAAMQVHAEEERVAVLLSCGPIQYSSSNSVLSSFRELMTRHCHQLKVSCSVCSSFPAMLVLL